VRKIVVFVMMMVSAMSYAQYNIDRLLMIGRSALYYEDYVLSIQYFNQAISAKPYLYEPWFFRGVAKYNLDDYAGAEADCSEAIKHNPYVVNIYELRGLSRIQLKKYEGAIDDYTQGIKYAPDNQGFWHNRVLCRINLKDYKGARLELDSMVNRWKKYARGYAMLAEVDMLEKDTTSAIKQLDKSLEIDPYDGQTWMVRAAISLSRSKWKDGEKYLDKAIHLLPKTSSNYLNRAIARVNQNNLRGAMSDYDMALDLEPNSFLGHYNRGLLRSQVGDDNRAITDFDFVLKLAPDNLMALFNRAILLDKTGNPRAAIRDFTKVINEFPNFWTGLQYRAHCYRRLGMTKQAEADEFRIYKAQLYKNLYGTQPRLNKKQRRRFSDTDISKYNQLVVNDEEEIEHQYSSEYRGRVQNRKVEIEILPMYELSMEKNAYSEVRDYITFDQQVENFNTKHKGRKLNVIARQTTLDEDKTAKYFALIDSLSRAIDRQRFNETLPNLMRRAVAYTALQDYESAINDLSICLQSDSTLAIAYWQRAVCQSKINQFNASQGTDIAMQTANVYNDIMSALKLNLQSPYLIYNRANVYAARKDYSRAIDDYTHALELDPNMAEAYYNRGLVRLFSGKKTEGIADLSKAGELGLYEAYSVIKKYRKE